ncbi:MAG: response regulator [Magnetococcus sp. YQC-3]
MNKHILVIDDNESMRISMTRILERNGYKVSTAIGGRDGLEIFKNYKFDLVVTDIFMSENDGVWFLIELKKLQLKVKLIAMSGGSKIFKEWDIFLNATKDLGVHYTLRKPFSNDELLTTIKSLF